MFEIVHGRVAIVLVLLLAGCATLADSARIRAAADFSCPASEVTVSGIGAGAVRARGCGQTATYVCRGGWGAPALCVHDDDATRAVGSGPPRSDESMMRALAVARVALDECLPPGATRIRFTVDETGAVTYAAVADAETGGPTACIESSFRGVRIDEPAAAARTATVRVMPRQPSAATIASAEEGPIEAPSSDAPRDEGTGHETSLRAAVTMRRAAILACVGVETAALAIAYTAAGDLSISLRGSLAGSDEEECVQAALADVRMDPAPGAAGSLIHAVTRE